MGPRLFRLIAFLVFLSAVPTLFAQTTAAEFAAKGTSEFAERRFASAYEAYSQCLQLDPKASHCAYNMGLSKYRLGEYEVAIANYSKAIAISPQWSRPYFSRAVVYEYQYKNKECIEDYTKAISYDAKLDAAYSGRANCRQRSQDYANADRDLTSAIQLRPLKEYFNARGLVRNNLKDYRGALSDLKFGANDITATEYHHTQRGIAAENLRLWSDAIAAYSRAIDLSLPPKAGVSWWASSRPMLYFKRGVMYLNAGNTTSAISDFTKTLDMIPEYGDALLKRAEAYRKLGKVPFAIADEQKAAAIKRATNGPAPVPVATPAPARASKPVPSRIPSSKPMSDFEVIIDGAAAVSTAYDQKNYDAVIKSATDSISKIAVIAEGEPREALGIDLYAKIFELRGFAYFMKGLQTQSLADLKFASQVYQKGVIRHMGGANKMLSGKTGYALLTSVVQASGESGSAVRVCKSGEVFGQRWIDFYKGYKNVSDAQTLGAGISMILMRDTCGQAFQLNGGMKLLMADVNKNQSSQYLNEAVQNFNEAITRDRKNKSAYEDRAAAYRKLGRGDLAAQDEATARSL